MAFNKDKLAKKAQKLMRKGQLQKALELYRKIVDKYPSEMRYWKKIGDIQVKNGNKNGAINTYLHISDEFIQKGFFKKAVAILRQIQSLDKDNQEVFDKLATVYIKTDFIPDALHQLEQLQKIQKENNEQDKLIATLRKMADIDPSHVVHRVHLAETLSKMNNRREASAEFKKVADYLDKNNKTEDFIKVAERYLFHSPEDKDYIKKLGHAYLETDKPHKIVKRLLKIYQSDPADMDNLHLLARVFIALNNLPKAIKVYKEMARLLKEQGKTGESQAVLKKILELDPKDKATKKALGILRKQESSQAAKPEIEEIEPDQIETVKADEIEEDEIEELELDEDDIEVLDDDDLIIIEEDALNEDQKKLVEETEAFIKFGLLDKARENLTEIEDLDHYKVHEVKMKISLKMGKKTDALQIMQTLLEKYPEDQKNKKEDIIQRALELEPECKWAIDAKESLSKSSSAQADNMSTQQIAAILDFDDSLDDAFSMMDEIESAEQELSFSDYHPDFEDMDNHLHSDEEVDEVLSQQEEQLYLESDNPEEIEDDIEDMLTSLKGLNDELSSKPAIDDSQSNQVILDEIDELQALKDASQSFIRINELSKEQKIDNIDRKFDFSNSKSTDQQLELNDEVFEFDNSEGDAKTPVVEPPLNIDEDAQTPVVEIDPHSPDFEPSVQAQDEDFNLNLENTEFELDTIDSKNGDKTPASESEEEFSDQETMQKFDEMMEFSSKVSDEISVISSATKLKNSVKAAQDIVDDQSPEPSKPEVEEELPEEVSDALEEIDFFISIESMEEAVRCFQEIAEWHSHSALQKYFELLDITGSPEPKQKSTEAAQSESQSEDFQEQTDKQEKFEQPETELEEQTPVDNLEKFTEEDIREPEKANAVPQTDQLQDDNIEDLSFEFSQEEESQIEHLNLDDNEESTSADQGVDGDESMRIETEKPIGDASSHLDLGLAYKGMGLYKQALEELKYAMEDEQYETQARILAAKCKQALGQASEAANTLKYALHNQNIKEEEKLAVYYELGNVYNDLGDKDEALYFFKKVARTNSSYRKVQNKIEKLSIS